MKKLFINSLSFNDVLTSYNFARNSNVIYSEAVTLSQFEDLSVSQHRQYTKSNNMIIYKLKEFILNENDIIFCHTDFIYNLFSDLKNIKTLKNVTLLTNQTDDMITKNFLLKKPKCISNWYSINVSLDSDMITSIPLGLSNNYYPKNLRSEDYINLNLNKKNLPITMYVNFRITNFKEREILYEQFHNYDWAKISEPNISLDSYITDLNKSTFTLAPWGNGVDTHRIWEAIYAGSIPITKYHRTFKGMQNLPILFINDYKEITYERLEQFYEENNYKNFSREELTVSFWMNKINSETKIESNLNEIVKERIISNKFIDYSRLLKQKLKSLNKKVKFYLRKIKKIPKILNLSNN